MGIWNVPHDADHGGARQLITPHGDLEPRDEHGARGGHVVLITPHGDLERPAVAAYATRLHGSLPLMGIWNVRSSPSDSAAAAISLPLMGIWNRAEEGRRGPGRQAHYPSWGFGTGLPRGPGAKTAAAHYPSWGFGTATRTGREAARRRPHYPSWGFGTNGRRTAKRRLAISLPLMGIWNLYSYRHAKDRRETHYPSWGFGTDSGSSPRPYILRSHYPSWGFGTGAVPDGAEEEDQLITPHGDLEPPAAATLRQARRLLITPHGDLEPGVDEQPPMRCVGLITPHGDLERHAAELQSPEARAHYPSWGFGTRSDALRERGRRAPHYPSWGFGTLLFKMNPNRPSIAHYPSWGFGTIRSQSGHAVLYGSLPLMGIWNRDEIGEQGDRPVDLITPHGDLEPPVRSVESRMTDASHYPSWGFGTAGWLRRACLQAGAHYPSWGFGTRLRERLKAAGVRSLPLMGIWNLEACGRDPATPYDLITPHGDLERDAGRAERQHRIGGLITPHGDLERGPGAFRSRPCRASLPLMGIWNGQSS